jgi:histidyl-tRNA synthetase
LEYASALKIPYVIIVGPAEIKQGKVKFRNMETGKETMATLDQVVKLAK